MNDTDPILLPRREFLRGATLLAAAAMLVAEAATKAAASPPASPAGASASPGPASLTSLAFWSGSSFGNPASYPAGDSSLTAGGVHVQIHGYYVPSGAAPLLHVLKAHYAVLVNGKLIDTPYYAWVATKQTGKDPAFHAPVFLAGGLLLSLELSAANSAEEFYFLATGNTAGQAKLRPGDYVIAAGTPDWRGCRIAQENGVSSIVRNSSSAPVNFEYLLITVSAA